MKVSTLGIDLAKNVFQLHGVDHEGHTILRKKLTRAKFVQFVMQLEPCLIGMEACSSSHHFARLFSRYGHESTGMKISTQVAEEPLLHRS